MIKKTIWIINQYATTPETGLAGRSFYLAEELAKKGHKVYLVAATSNHQHTSSPNIPHDYFVEKVRNVNFLWIKTPKYAEAHSKQRAINWLIFTYKLNKLKKLIKHTPDTIICSSPSLIPFLGAERLSKNFKCQLVYEVRDIWPLTLIEIGGFSKTHPAITLMRLIEKRAYKKSDIVLSNLKNSIQHMINSGLSPEKFHWLPNGFSFREVTESLPISFETKALIPKDKFIVGYTGTIGVSNCLDTLIESAEILKNIPEIHFVLLGRGKEKKNLESLATKKGLKNITFIDPIPKPQIQSMLENFDVCYLGLTNDPLFIFGVSPNKLFDYLYASKPIIYAINSGDYHPVTEANAGLEIEPQNPINLANSIKTLYDMDEDQRLQLGSNGRKTAIDKYEYSLLANKLYKILYPSQDY